MKYYVLENKDKRQVVVTNGYHDIPLLKRAIKDSFQIIEVTLCDTKVNKIYNFTKG